MKFRATESKEGLSLVIFGPENLEESRKCSNKCYAIAIHENNPPDPESWVSYLNDCLEKMK